MLDQITTSCSLCSKPVKAKGLCSMHKSRLDRHGDPTHKGITPKCPEGCSCGRHSPSVPNSGTFTSDTSKMAARVHGMSYTPTYRVWANMINRCTRERTPYWKDYGGRGITVCASWRTFVNFLADMGERPGRLTLDRIDNDGNYEPGNCRWATWVVQRSNQRRPG